MQNDFDHRGASRASQTSDNAGGNRSGGQHGLVVAARIGYAARGVVYLLVAGIAIAAAFGNGGETEGTHGAIESLRSKPAGAIMLGALALGLVGYAVWRFMQAVFDADDHGTDAKGLTIRAGLLISALTHLALALFTASLIFDWDLAGASASGSDAEESAAGGGMDRAIAAGAGGGEESERTAWLLSLPYGRWITFAIAAGIFGAGIAQLIKGAKAGYKKWLDIKPQHMKLASPICRFGLMARGVVFALIAFGFALAAWQYDPDQAKGLGEVLSTLRDEPFGQALFALMAFGLLAFAIYSFIEAATRRIHPESS